MNFELGKEYIVAVTNDGIVPIDEFNRERFYDKDNDDLDFLTNEEKIVVINDMLDKIRAEMEQIKEAEYQIYGKGSWKFVDKCLDIIDKYKKSEG